MEFKKLKAPAKISKYRRWKCVRKAIVNILSITFRLLIGSWIIIQIFQYVLLLSGGKWPFEVTKLSSAIFFAAGLAEEDEIGEMKPKISSSSSPIWFGISIVCFIIYFAVLVENQVQSLCKNYGNPSDRTRKVLQRANTITTTLRSLVIVMCCGTAVVSMTRPNTNVLAAVFLGFIIVLTLIGPGLQLFQVTSNLLLKLCGSCKAKCCKACLRRLRRLNKSARDYFSTHFHSINAILEIAEILAQLIALHKTSELPVRQEILYMWGSIIALNSFIACAPWFEHKHSMNLLKTIIYLDATFDFMYAVVVPILIRQMSMEFCNDMKKQLIYRNGVNLQNEMCEAISAKIYLSGVVTGVTGLFGQIIPFGALLMRVDMGERNFGSDKAWKQLKLSARRLHKAAHSFVENPRDILTKGSKKPRASQVAQAPEESIAVPVDTSDKQAPAEVKGTKSSTVVPSQVAQALGGSTVVVPIDTSDNQAPAKGPKRAATIDFPPAKAKHKAAPKRAATFGFRQKLSRGETQRKLSRKKCVERSAHYPIGILFILIGIFISVLLPVQLTREYCEPAVGWKRDCLLYTRPLLSFSSTCPCTMLEYKCGADVELGWEHPEVLFGCQENPSDYDYSTYSPATVRFCDSNNDCNSFSYCNANGRCANCDLCAQLMDPINEDKKDPSQIMVGCKSWCEASLKLGFGAFKGSSLTPRPLGDMCREEVFHTTREEYIQLLRDRDATPPKKSNQEIRKILAKTATRTESRPCEEGLYCATVPQPMIESLIVNQVYQFATGRCDKCERCKNLGLDECSKECPDEEKEKEKHRNDLSPMSVENFMKELAAEASTTMVVMLLKRCQGRFTGSTIPKAAFTKVTHLELSSLDVSLQSAVELTTGNLIMIDMSHTTNLRVPPKFGQEARTQDLKHLYLSNCSLQELPESLGSLKSLVTLDIASNKLSRLPTVLPPMLQGLYASDNQLTALPTGLQSLTGMKTLDVTNNHNLQRLPPLLGAKAKIHTVLASCCNLDTPLPESLFGGGSVLRTLSLRSSNLKQLPVNLGSAKKLRGYLSLGRNQLTSLPPSIGHNTKLTGLSLDNNKALQVLPQGLASLEQLKTFDCKSCESLKPCSGCLPKNLSRLIVTGSPHFDVLDAMSAPLENLTVLDASFTAITLRPHLPRNFSKMTQLKTVRLNGCGGGPRISALPVDWWKLVKLQEAQLEGLALQTLPKFGTKILKTLSLRGNKQARLNESYVNELVLSKRPAVVAGCSAYMSVLAQQKKASPVKKQAGESSGKTPKRKPRPRPGGRRLAGRGPRNSGGTTKAAGANGGKKPTTKPAGASGGKRGASGGKKPTTKAAGASGGKKPTTKPKGASGGNAKGRGKPTIQPTSAKALGYVNTYASTYAVSLSATLAVAYFPSEENSCLRSKLMLMCSQSERSYCRTQVAKVPMCAALAKQNGSVAEFCEEEETVKRSEICNEYLDHSVPTSICRPSCARNPSGVSRRFSLNWSTSGVAACHGYQNNTCEPSKVVFCTEDGHPAASKGLGCIADECKQKYCDFAELGHGQLRIASDYIGSAS